MYWRLIKDEAAVMEGVLVVRKGREGRNAK